MLARLNFRIAGLSAYSEKIRILDIATVRTSEDAEEGQYKSYEGAKKRKEC